MTYVTRMVSPTEHKKKEKENNARISRVNTGIEL